MIVNKVAHLFILHVLNNLDDTVLSKKKILQDILVTVDDNIHDPSFQNLFLGIYCPESRRYFTKDDIEAFTFLQQHSTSKKDKEQRRKELLQAFNKPLEVFFEENFSKYISDVQKNPLIVKVVSGRMELGGVNQSDFMDEFFR
mmetsp:Transcript_8408/g.14067  ORF Transcript_8408/g.14067 Transcript_8408/m.14067 type:complete len:143 (+) Transcript_8408:1135-1563(+)